MTNEQALAEWRRRYETGDSLYRIALAYDMDQRKLRAALVRAGVQIRGRGTPRGARVPNLRRRERAA